jgi:hypothetical protein
MPLAAHELSFGESSVAINMRSHTSWIVPLTDRDELAVNERAPEIEIPADLIDRLAGTRNFRGELWTSSIVSTVERSSRKVCDGLRRQT